MSRPTQGSAFLRLPTELRVPIYELVLLHHRSDRYKSKIDIDSKDGAPPSLLQTCRLIREESSPVFLKNEFRVAIRLFDAARIESWFSLFPEACRENIHLTICWSRSSSADGSSLERKANLLKLLEGGFTDTSSILPPRSHRVWTRVTRDLKECATYDIGLLDVFNALDVRRYEKLQELARFVSELRCTGLSWLEVRGSVETVVDIAEICT